MCNNSMAHVQPFQDASDDMNGFRHCRRDNKTISTTIQTALKDHFNSHERLRFEYDLFEKFEDFEIQTKFHLMANESVLNGLK